MGEPGSLLLSRTERSPAFQSLVGKGRERVPTGRTLSQHPFRSPNGRACVERYEPFAGCSHCCANLDEPNRMKVPFDLVERASGDAALWP